MRQAREKFAEKSQDQRRPASTTLSETLKLRLAARLQAAESDNANGEESRQIVSRLRPGDTFNSAAFVLGDTRNDLQSWCGVVAETSCVVARLDRDYVLSVISYSQNVVSFIQFFLIDAFNLEVTS